MKKKKQQPAFLPPPAPRLPTRPSTATSRRGEVRGRGVNLVYKPSCNKNSLLYNNTMLRAGKRGVYRDPRRGCLRAPSSLLGQYQPSNNNNDDNDTTTTTNTYNCVPTTYYCSIETLATPAPPAGRGGGVGLLWNTIPPLYNTTAYCYTDIYHKLHTGNKGSQPSRDPRYPPPYQRGGGGGDGPGYTRGGRPIGLTTQLLLLLLKNSRPYPSYKATLLTAADSYDARRAICACN